jgi:hypothetical protein
LGEQKRFEEAEKRADRDWMDEAEVLQRQVVREFGYKGDRRVEQVLRTMRVFALDHPELPIQVGGNAAFVSQLQTRLVLLTIMKLRPPS